MSQTTNRAEYAYNPINLTQNAIDYNLFKMNTVLPCEIIEADNNTNRYTVKPLNYGISVEGSPIEPPLIHNIPAMTKRGANAGVIIEYQVGDNVAVAFCQRDITSIKKNWKRNKPNTFRKFSLSDGIILDYLGNDKPSIFVKITPSGIEITAPDLPVTINSQTTTVNADSVEVNADSIKLGENALNSILLQDVPISATITNVQSGSDTVSTVFTASAGGSTVAKAKI